MSGSGDVEEKGDLPMKKSNNNVEDGEEAEDVEDASVAKEPFCTKERILRMVFFLVVSIANKVIAIRMIKKGAHKPDSCPASDAIPQFLLGEHATHAVSHIKMLKNCEQ